MQSLIYAFKWLVHTTLPAGRVLGIPLRVQLLFVILLTIGIFYLSAFALRSAQPWVIAGFAVAFFVMLYASIIAHEFGHAWGNRLVGGHTEAIILTPIGGIALGSGASLSPRAELLVTILGPAVSLLLAVIGQIGVWLTPDPNPYASSLQLMDYIGGFFYLLASINTLLFVFNMTMPLFPMDCARLLRAGFSLKYNPGAVTYRICQLGIGLGIFLIAAMFLKLDLPFYGPVGPWLAIIGFLGLQSSMYEMERIKYGPVYAKSDEWGSRTVFYDKEDMARAKARAFEDIGGLLKRKPSSTARKKRPRRSGPAKIIDISEVHDPERVSDPARLQQMMKEAADQEDFTMAARIQKRLKELKERGHKSGNE